MLTQRPGTIVGRGQIASSSRPVMTHFIGYLFLRAYALYRKRQLAGP